MLVEEIQHLREYRHVAQSALHKRQDVSDHGTRLSPLNQVVDLERSGEIHNPTISLNTDSVSTIPSE